MLALVPFSVNQRKNKGPYIRKVSQNIMNEKFGILHETECQVQYAFICAQYSNPFNI